MCVSICLFLENKKASGAEMHPAIIVLEIVSGEVPVSY